jgi:hypothetical protein
MRNSNKLIHFPGEAEQQSKLGKFARNADRDAKTMAGKRSPKMMFQSIIMMTEENKRDEEES